MAQSIGVNAYEINGNPRSPRPPIGLGLSSQSLFSPYTGNDSRLYGVVTRDGVAYATVETVNQLIAKANS